MLLYNSATHKKETFQTHTPGHVEMYTCGPTVYHFAHIGNLRSYIMEDVLEKYLRYAGYDVNRVMNITDVGHLTSDADEGEDKMVKGAKREHKTVMEIAQYYTDAFFEDCRKLNIKRREFAEDDGPLDPACSCYTCRTFSRAYLRPLYVSQELLSFRLNSIHNLTYFLDTVRGARAAIREGRWAEYKRRYEELYDV